jgi:hypothetical protein
MEENTTLQNLLRSTDENGRFTFSTEDQSYLEREEGQTFQEFMGAHVVWFMDEYSGFLTRFETSKSSTRQLEIKAVPIEGKQAWQVSFNMARMVRLPGVNPKAELLELCGFLDSMKPFFEAYASMKPRVRMTNNRDSHRRTYGLLECFFRDPKDTGNKSANAEEFSKQLMDRVNESEVLSKWLKQLALDLNIAGPYSWFSFKNEQLFEDWENPVLRRRRMSA